MASCPASSMARRRTSLWLALASSLVVSGTPGTAAATWSIAAVDRRTGEVGVAVASCIAGVDRVIALAPGIGAVAAQAYLEERSRDVASRLLSEGVAPAEVVERVKAQDPEHAIRQYGVVDLRGRVSAYTGAETGAWAGHSIGTDVSAQGNLLTGPDVVAAALRAFEAAPPDPGAWTLADRLLAALEAGASHGGDRRCDPEQTALSAALRVAASAATPPGTTRGSDLNLYVARDPGAGSPVVALRDAYELWRRERTGGAPSASSSLATSSAASRGPARGSCALRPPSPGGASPWGEGLRGALAVGVAALVARRRRRREPAPAGQP